jgi:hypothetical protein
MAQKDLRRVQRLARKALLAKAELRDAILVAHRAGESIRDIAPFAGMSPSRVYELLKEAKRLERDSGEPG